MGELPDDGVPVERLPEWFRGWGKNKSWPLKPGHNLEQLTSYLCHLLAQPSLFPDDPSGLEPGHAWGRLILDLHELDPDGSGLRYTERWDKQRSAVVPTGRPGLGDVERPPNVLLDVEVMADDLAKLLGRIGAAHCRIAETRLAPLDEAER